MFFQECCSGSDSLQYMFDKFFLIHSRVATTFMAFRIGCIIGQSLTQGFYDADIVNDQAVCLTFRYTIGTGNGLHQRMRFHRLVNVKTGECLHVETCQPHGADKDHAQLGVSILELLVKFLFLHALTMRLDI